MPLMSTDIKRLRAVLYFWPRQVLGKSHGHFWPRINVVTSWPVSLVAGELSVLLSCLQPFI